MSPPTNGAVSLAPFPPMGPLSDALLFQFDGLSYDYFALPAAPSPLVAAPAAAADPPLLLLPPSSRSAHGVISDRGMDLAARTYATEMTPSPRVHQPPPPSPAPPLVHGTGHRTSCFRGVTRHRWTGRYEAHLWDNTCRREGQKRKGRQAVWYISGGYEKEDKAARAYDLAALKYWGSNATTNFPKESYAKEIEEMQNMSKQELVASLRRKSSGFSRGASIYRGVTRHHQHGRWQARIGRVAGNKDLYLGTFASEEEAAEAYDIAALKFRGANAVTNFEPSRYNLEAISQSDLPISLSGRRLNNKPAPGAEGQITLSSPPISQQSSSSNNASPYLINSLLQFQPCGPPHPQALPLPGYNFAEHGIYWPFGDVEQKVHVDSKVEMVNGRFQLANYAAN
ncbi:hypothetical protein ABZP36_019876 [Zizania latifolia]